jgi:hypothetical protein
MRYWLAFCLGVAVGAGATALPGIMHHVLANGRGHEVPVSHAPEAGINMRFRNDFSFVAQAPIDVAGPLFGADKERGWAPDWNPVFLWPQDAGDQPGMVFTIAHGDKTAVWVNTVFDLAAGRAQYVYVLPDVVATVVSVQLAPIGNTTRVVVTYERTALREAARDVVRHMAERDANAGPEWEHQINAYLTIRR